RVSARCRSVESGSPPRTAATPPWAHRVVAWASADLVSTPTRSGGSVSAAARTAADSPATPLPSTSRSRSGTGGSGGRERSVRRVDRDDRGRVPAQLVVLDV